jgi:membrane-associated phospholipid phosphatase
MLGAWYLILGLALLGSERYVASGLRYLPQHAFVLGMIAALALLANRNRWLRFAHDWYPIFVFIAAFEEIARLSLVFVPYWQDAALIRAESVIFRTPPNVWSNQWQSLATTEVLEFGYFTFYWIMPLVGGVLYSLAWKTQSNDTAASQRQPFRVWMDATVLGYMLCYAFYLLFPTEGPAHTITPQASRLVSAGPFHWLVLTIQRHGGVHGNAFPSGHIMASVVALLAAFKWKPCLGFWLAIPVLLMCFGAVYDGYHYASDIVAGAVVGIVCFSAVIAIRYTNPPSVS